MYVCGCMYLYRNAYICIFMRVCMYVQVPVYTVCMCIQYSPMGSDVIKLHYSIHLGCEKCVNI